MLDFAAIDFETANGQRSSVCSVGIVIVRNGQIVDEFYSLIQPAPNYYTYWTTEIHGLTRLDTDGQPDFPQVWAQIEDKIKGLPLVAHNRPFDESCLKAVFEEYGMECRITPNTQAPKPSAPSCGSRMRIRNGKPS